MLNSKLKVRILPIAQLIPAAYNPRRTMDANSPAYRKLAASLREFGLVEPLVWNELTGHVVGGHMRLRILKDLGVHEVPVSVVRLSPSREKALNVMLNNREAQGRYDPAKLADVLEELHELEEISLSGFEPADLSALRMEPIQDLDAQAETGVVEITLSIHADAFVRLSPRLDELVGDFDLTCHIKRR